MRNNTDNVSLDVSGMLNAKQFGAIGDGLADDTQALQGALDAAAPRHGTVFVPDGVYLTSILKFSPHTGLVGNATWGYRTGGGSVLRLKESSAPCLLDISGAVGATINGLSLEGGDLGKEVHGIHMGPLAEKKKEEDSPRIERCHVSHFTGNGIHLAPVWCFSVRSCEIIFNQGHALYVEGWDGFILDNWLSGNGGAGYSAPGPNASVTMTGNRIEWNKGGGIVIKGGSHYNITGNYIDRSGGPAITVVSQDQGSPSNCLTISGNVIYRSGKPEWTSQTDEFQSSHVRLEGARGLVFTGNAMCVGQDDGSGSNSPAYGLVLQGLKNCVIQNNTLHIGALKQIVVDRGGHGEGVLLKDNVGSLLPNPGQSIWEPGQRD